MRFASLIIICCILIAGASLALVGANIAVTLIERNSVERIDTALDNDGQIWTDVTADGLQIQLSGTAPSEASRFRALTIAGGIVDAHRVIDQMSVAAAEAIAAPRFSVEILRNGDGISLIGLIPEASDRETIVERIGEMSRGGRIADMLETASHDIPEGWPAAMDYAVEALSMLPRSKISVSARLVTITAISDSAAERDRLEEQLLQRAPSNIELVLDISAPRPVITPFTLRFLIENGEGKFDACAADTEFTRARILNAARQISSIGDADCVVGLGNPSPHWGSAVETAIRALAEIGGGSVTFSDADVTLIAPDTTPQAVFDRVTGELETDLPAVFALHAILPEPVDPVDDAAGPPEFSATLSPEGLVQLRGRITDERTRIAVNSYAQSQFGSDQIYMATNLDSELPDGWPLRVLAGLEALSYLSSGGITILPDNVEVHGVTGNMEASASISRLLSAKLGEAQAYSVNVAYNEQLDPVADLPTPQECVDGVNAVLSESKLTFAPGSADFEPGAGETLNSIAELLENCHEVPMEIAGHTDSQGREEMNQNLSQSRANAVLNALMARRVLTSNLTARGYGESIPIADNETEEGREANRRIEFTLVVSRVPTAGDGEEGEATVEEEAEEAPEDEQN